MNLTSIVIASIILSIMTMSSSQNSILLLEIEENRLQSAYMADIKASILDGYVYTNTIETDLTALNQYSIYDYSKIKDRSDSDFVILDNGGTPFSLNGVGSYSAVVIAPFADGTDSAISSNNLEIFGGEEYLLVATSELSASPRGKTIEKIASCNNASSNYQIIVGSSPTSVLDLVAGGYIEAKDVVDSFGRNFLLDGSDNCYSSGVDGIDNNKTGDDIA